MTEVEQEIIERLTRIETLLEPLATANDRISALERWRSWTTGIAVGIGAVVGGMKWLLTR